MTDCLLKFEDFLTSQAKSQTKKKLRVGGSCLQIFKPNYIRPYLQRCRRSGLLISGASLGRAFLRRRRRWVCAVSAPLVWDEQAGENIFKEATWSLKAKRHVVWLRRAVSRSGIGSRAAFPPTNRGPVIRRGEQRDCSWTLTRCHLTPGFFPQRLGIWAEVTVHPSHSEIWHWGGSAGVNAQSLSCCIRTASGLRHRWADL